jgi:hypothetical protein
MAIIGLCQGGWHILQDRSARRYRGSSHYAALEERAPVEGFLLKEGTTFSGALV